MSIDKDTLKQFTEVLNMQEDKLQQLLKLYDVAKEELENILFEIYKKYDSEILYNELQKFGRMDKLQNNISHICKNLSKKDITMTTGILSHIVAQSYYRNAYVLEKNFQLGINFKLLRDEVIQELIDYPVKGLRFSERIWFNQEKLNQNLKAAIIDGIFNGKDIKFMTKQLDEVMNAGKNNCSRLIRTETAKIWYQGQKKIYEDSSVVKKVLYIATLDGRTSQICRERDGKVYELGKEPQLPAHPNCRSTYAPYFDELKNIKRKDNETGEVIDYKNYEEWSKSKGITQ